MSRYSLKPYPHRADVFELAVGWDADLDTYFVVVFGVPAPGHDPEVLHWRGGRPRQIPSVEALGELVGSHAMLDPELILQLDADKRAGSPNAKKGFSRFISSLLDYG